MDKAELRKLCKSDRDALDISARRAIDVQICATVIKSSEFSAAHTVFAYAPIGSEIDIMPVIEECWHRGKTLALPRVMCPSSLEWYIVEDADAFNALHTSKLGIKEPNGDANTLILESNKGSQALRFSTLANESKIKAERSLVLVPALAFDKRGFRLGYGGGYYDVFLGLLKASNIDATTMGVARSTSVVDDLGVLEATQPHDIPVDIIVTEKKVLLPGNSEQ